MILRVVGAIAAAAAIALAAVLLLGGGGGYQVRLNLVNADGLRPGSRVEIGGVAVGSVNSLQITPADHALATITINGAAAPIGSDASVVVRPANLLGEKYLDVTVGDRAHPGRSGFSIPATRTADAPDLDQVLGVLAPTTRDRLAILIHEAGVALFGRGRDLAAVLSSLPPSLTDAQALIAQVTASNANLQGLLTHAGSVVASVSAQRQALGDLVSTAAGAFTATAARQQQLAATVANAPGTLAALRTTLQQLDVAGAALRPAATGLQATAPGLTSTLQALPGFTAAALPTLSEVRAASADLTRLGTQAAPVIARLRPTAGALQTLAADANPLTGALDTSAADLLGTLQNWARAIQAHDSLGHEFRVSVELTPSLLKTLAPQITGALKLPAAKRPAHRASPASRPPAAPSGAGQSSGGQTSTGQTGTQPPATGTTTTTPTLPPVLANAPAAAAPIVNGVKGLLGYLLGK